MSSPVLAAHGWWLASRAAGVVAMLLVSVSVGLGLANAARLLPSRTRRAVLAVHQRAALAALVSIAAHGLLLLLGLSFYVRGRIGPRLWRRLHRATTAVYLMSVVHTLTAGTDAGTAWLRALLMVSGAPVVALLAARVLRQLARRPPRPMSSTAS